MVRQAPPDPALADLAGAADAARADAEGELGAAEQADAEAGLGALRLDGIGRGGAIGQDGGEDHGRKTLCFSAAFSSSRSSRTGSLRFSRNHSGLLGYQ